PKDAISLAPLLSISLRLSISPRRHGDTEECSPSLSDLCAPSCPLWLSVVVFKSHAVLTSPRSEPCRCLLPIVILSDSELASAKRGGVERSRECRSCRCRFREFARCFESLVLVPGGTWPSTPETNDLSFVTPESFALFRVNSRLTFFCAPLPLFLCVSKVLGLPFRLRAITLRLRAITRDFLSPGATIAA